MASYIQPTSYAVSKYGAEYISANNAQATQAKRDSQASRDSRRREQEYYRYLKKMSDEYQASYNEAKAANEQRYQQILAGHEGLGVQGAADIRSTFSDRGAALQQDMVSRGLAGTTIMPSARTGLAREEAEAIARLRENVTGNKLAFMERRSDTYPNRGEFMQLANMLGSSGR